MNKTFIYIINLYRRFVSPMMVSRCRFYPTCSEYAIQAFEEFGFLRAFYLTIKRLARCQPFCKGGVDPLPTPQNKHG